MKKWVFLLVAVALIGSIYIFIPRQLIISKILIGSSNINSANRCFSDTSQWVKWFPSDSIGGADSPRGPSFSYKGCTFRIDALLYEDVKVLIQCPDRAPLETDFRIVSLNRDSIYIGWQGSLQTSRNPFKRILQYRQAKQVKTKMEEILTAFDSFIAKTINIYGLDFHQTMSRDSTLVTMNAFTAIYPGTGQIYQMIDSLKAYVASQGAQEINYPMLNVSKMSDGKFRTMVAISVNRELPGTSRIIIKRFVPWKMLEGEVRGGVYSVDKAFEQFYNYKNDHLNSVMAIPFQSLITDRRKESDTSKWVTKICAPIS